MNPSQLPPVATGSIPRFPRLRRLRTHAENAFVIGDVMKPVLVNKNLFNVPTEGAHGYDAIRFQPNHPEQFFFRG